MAIKLTLLVTIAIIAVAVVIPYDHPACAQTLNYNLNYNVAQEGLPVSIGMHQKVYISCQVTLCANCGSYTQVMQCM